MLQDYKCLEKSVRRSPYSLEDSRANRIALRENVSRLVMNVICGGNSQESFAKLDQSGSWRKTYQGYCQVSMEGFLDEFCGTWPTWGIMRDGECFRLSKLEWSTNAKEFVLLPTPLATDGMAWTKVGKNCLKTMRYIFSCLLYTSLLVPGM